MISIDKGLLGQGQLGDVVPRHRQYGEFCEQLDIIVFSGQKVEVNEISSRVRAFSTNSKGRLKYYSDALKLGQQLFAKTQYDLIVTQEPFLTGLAGYKLKKQFGAKLLIHFHGDFWQNRRWRR
ncbi:MAG: glycosyltransferase family 4 protein, partial [Patescibacteria group bacterium]|nr:glycosyltransferase family 4 protein [Patescibacteria group bacterium]